MPENDMGNVSKISLEISVTSNATAQIKELTESVTSLIDAFSKTEKPFQKIEEHLNKLSDTARELGRAMQSVKDLPKIAAAAQRATNGATKKMASAGKSVVSADKKAPTSTAGEQIPPMKMTRGEAFLEWDKLQENMLSHKVPLTVENMERLEELYDIAFAKQNRLVAIGNKLKDVFLRQVKSLQDSGDAAKKATPWWQKLGKQMGRIALYRTIRFILKEIAQAAKEGVQNVALFDDRTNEAISNIKNTWGGATNAFGSAFSELIIMAEPLLVQLGESLMDFGNNLAMVLAKLNGSPTYKKAIKNNEDYAESLQKVNNRLLSFDKFETLNAKNSDVNFKEVAIDEDWNAGSAMLQGFGETLQFVIGTLKGLASVLTGDWSSWWKDFTSGENTLSSIAGLALAAAAAFAVVKLSVTSLSSTFGKMFMVVAAGFATFTLFTAALESMTPVARTVISVLATMVGLLAAAWGASLVATHQLAGLAIFAAGIGGIVAGVKGFMSGVSDLTPQYAAGGFPEDGLFYANHGELVGQFSNGKTAVANNEQIVAGISDGVYPAVYQAVMDAMRQRGDKGLNVYLDGQLVGRGTANAVYGELKRVGKMQ